MALRAACPTGGKRNLPGLIHVLGDPGCIDGAARRRDVGGVGAAGHSSAASRATFAVEPPTVLRSDVFTRAEPPDAFTGRCSSVQAKT